MRLHDFKVLTFDCYGTLIDWETGLFDALQPLRSRAAPGLDRDVVLETFARLQSAQEEATPAMIYSALLATVHRQLAQEWGVAPDPAEDMRFGVSVPDWPAFADSVAALAYLKRHYQLVILSNVDRVSFAGSNRRLEVEFDAIYTAQDIGSYKPNLANFHYMLSRLAERGIAPEKILHTAQSLYHDHGPAKQIGLASAWINRRHDRPGWGATLPPPAGAGYDFYDFRFESLAAMADAHARETV